MHKNGFGLPRFDIQAPAVLKKGNRDVIRISASRSLLSVRLAPSKNASTAYRAFARAYTVNAWAFSFYAELTFLASRV